MPFLIPAAIAIGSAVATAAFVASDVLIPLALGAIGISGGALAGVSAFATAVIETAALAGISAVLSPHPAVNTAGSPQQFKPDPNAPIPIVMGRYGVGGNLVYETTSGGGNKSQAGAAGNEYLTSFVILSGLGPVQAFETLRFNDTILTFDPNGQACNGGYIPEDEIQSWNPGYRHQNADGSYINNNYQDHAWQNLQLGALNAGYFAPPSKLASDNAALPEWTQAHGFSSLAAAALTLVYDQRYYAGGVPQYQWVLQGIKVYDPRQDSTYPGGNGPQRWAGKGASAAAIDAARATWTFNQNPAIHALNFALGYFLPDEETTLGRLYAGIGAGPAGVDMAAFVAAANVADANGWLICGQWTTGDGKWSVLTEMLKAGSATPVIDRGIISCIVDQPLTSLGTVTADDLSGPITLPTGSSFTARLNTVFPRFTSEQHRWQMVTADTPVKAATYVAEDGAIRSKTLDWQFVPAVNQACQCAAYTICNGREIPGITLPGKPKLRNYRVGDCFTLDVPESGLATTKVMVTYRSTDQATGGVTLKVRTETDAKHAYSLGVSGVAPATPGISGYDPTIVEAPLPDFWATGALEISDTDTGESRVVIRVTGAATDNVYAQTVVLRWRPVALIAGNYTPTGDASWSYRSFPASQGQFDLDLNPGVYDVQIAYITVNGAYPDADEDFLDLGIETVGGSTSASTASVPGTAAIPGDRTLSDALGDLAEAQANVGTLQGDVSDLQGGLTDALDTATSAQTIAANTGAVNSNPSFASYLQALSGQVPPSWIDAGGATGNIDWIAGLDSPNAMQVTLTAGETMAISSSTGGLSAAGSGWYVFELDAVLTSGSWAGTDLFVNTYAIYGQGGAETSVAAVLDPATDIDLNQQTGATVLGHRTWSKLVQLTPIGSMTLVLELNGGYGNTPAKALQVHRAAIRIASQPEIDGHQALGLATETSATVSDFQETQTNQNAAFAEDIGDVQVTAGANTADIETLQGAYADVAGKTVAYLKETVAASGSSPAEVYAASGDGTSIAKLIAAVVSLSNIDGSGVKDALTLIDGEAYFADKVFIGSNVYLDPSIPAFVAVNGTTKVIVGDGYGASGNMILWAGPASVDASVAARSNAILCIDTGGLYIPLAVNSSVANAASVASVDGANNTWTDACSCTFSIPGAGYWTAVEGVTDGYAASAPGAPANYGPRPEGGNGAIRVVERQAGQSDLVLASGTITVTTDVDGSQVSGDCSVTRIKSTYTGAVQLVAQIECTNASPGELHGIPVGVGANWTPAAS